MNSTVENIQYDHMGSLISEILEGAPIAVIACASLILIAVTWIIVRALAEGREISFWPPRIGQRPEPSAKVLTNVNESGNAQAVPPIPISSDNSLLPNLTIESAPIAMIRIEAGANLGRVYVIPEVTRTISLGRGTECDIILSDAMLSRTHARISIFPIDGASGNMRSYQFEILDAGSSNGTFLNGKSIDREILSNGDLIQIGGVQIRFSLIAQSLAIVGAKAV